MANISYRLGRRQPLGTIQQALRENKLATDSFDRMVSHLKANEVDLEARPIALGPSLTLDPEGMAFVGECSSEANAYVKRTYRKPFVLPDVV